MKETFKVLYGAAIIHLQTVNDFKSFQRASTDDRKNKRMSANDDMHECPNRLAIVTMMFKSRFA